MRSKILGKISGKSLSGLLLATVLVVGVGGAANVYADTIRLRDGSVIRGDIIGFGEQQFTVLLGQGTRGGRRSRITIYMEDVESIEFERAASILAANTNGNASTSGGDTNSNNASTVINPTTNVVTAATPPSSASTRTETANAARISNNNVEATPSVRSTNNSTTNNNPNASIAGLREASVRVRADATTNGWTNSGVILRKGQRVRLTASGRVALGQGRFSTPAGVANVDDEAKLMRTEPTGGLIAVIGDDNDNFIFVGARREFTAERDGVLFLGVNEGDLNDNTGNYDVTISYE